MKSTQKVPGISEGRGENLFFLKEVVRNQGHPHRPAARAPHTAICVNGTPSNGITGTLQNRLVQSSDSGARLLIHP